MNLPKKALAIFSSQEKILAAQMVLGRSSFSSPSSIKTKNKFVKTLQKTENTHLKNFT
jgi:hypothetical protein